MEHRKYYYSSADLKLVKFKSSYQMEQRETFHERGAGGALHCTGLGARTNKEVRTPAKSLTAPVN